MKIGINDLSSELALMIMNKFKIEKSVVTIEKNTLIVPLGLEYNPKTDELLVIKNSILLGGNDYKLDDTNSGIMTTEHYTWEATHQYPLEFNFIILKAAMPGVNASLWRGTNTILEKTKAVPITVAGFNRETDDIIVVKNGTIVSHDEYEIINNTIVAANDGVWNATKRSPVTFEYIVFKFVTPKNGTKINGHHILDGTISKDALNPDITELLNTIKIANHKIEFLTNAILKYGNFELADYLKNNLDNPESEISKEIEERHSEYGSLLAQYNKLGETLKSKEQSIIERMSRLDLLDNLNLELNEVESDINDQSN